jgi:hypothetical protein
MVIVLICGGCAVLSHGPPTVTASRTSPPASTEMSEPLNGSNVSLANPTTAADHRSIASVSASSTVSDKEGDSTDPLTQAAACLKRGEELQAAAHLEKYLREQPHAHLFRIQLAEIYHRGQQATCAQLHYEYFLWYLPSPAKDPLDQYAVLAHTRLREYALLRNDAFRETYHRAAGLLLLARSARQIHPSLADELLGQARQALTQAQSLRPHHPLLLARRLEMHELCHQSDTAYWERLAIQHSPLPPAITPALSLE